MLIKNVLLGTSPNHLSDTHHPPPTPHTPQHPPAVGWVPGGYLWLGALMIVVASLALMRQEARLVAA